MKKLLAILAIVIASCNPSKKPKPGEFRNNTGFIKLERPSSSGSILFDPRFGKMTYSIFDTGFNRVLFIDTNGKMTVMDSLRAITVMLSIIRRYDSLPKDVVVIFSEGDTSYVRPGDTLRGNHIPPCTPNILQTKLIQ